MSDSVCTSCGASLSCTADEGCWCMTVEPKVSIESASCLCPSCLAEHIEQTIANPLTISHHGHTEPPNPLK